MLKEAKKGLTIALFRVNDLTDPKHKFKVDITARDLQVEFHVDKVDDYQITGCVIMFKELTAVIAEGSHKAIKKFKKLMLRRIDWTRSVDADEKGDKSEKNGSEKQEEVSK